MAGPSVMCGALKGRVAVGDRRVCYCSCRFAPLRVRGRSAEEARKKRGRSMSSPASTSNPATPRLRGLLALLVLLCCALPCEAGRPVRATGRRESAEDPALASLVNDASRYVKSYGTGPRGEPQVVFDGAAVERGI